MKAASVAVAAVEIGCRKKLENQVVDQVDARRGWELRTPSRPSFLTNPNTCLLGSSVVNDHFTFTNMHHQLHVKLTKFHNLDFCAT